MIRTTVAIAGASMLSGCMVSDLPSNAAFLSQSTEPIYMWRGDGVVGSTACMTPRRARTRQVPSGCVLDSAFAGQIASTTHMVTPQTPGPAYSASVADAAYVYIYGEPANPDLALGGAHVAAGGQLVPVPQTGRPYPEDDEEN